MSFGAVLQVTGIPAPQGSKRLLANGAMIESSKKVAPWRLAIKRAVLAQTEGWPAFAPTDPLALYCEFRLPRPLSHYRTDGTLRPSAPMHHVSYPDVDKLLRSTGDGLVQSGLIADDSRIVETRAAKRYVNPGEKPGAAIIVRLAS